MSLLGFRIVQNLNQYYDHVNVYFIFDNYINQKLRNFDVLWKQQIVWFYNQQLLLYNPKNVGTLIYCGKTI